MIIDKDEILLYTFHKYPDGADVKLEWGNASCKRTPLMLR